jgi:hypothetical protein
MPTRLLIAHDSSAEAGAALSTAGRFAALRRA